MSTSLRAFHYVLGLTCAVMSAAQNPSQAVVSRQQGTVSNKQTEIPVHVLDFKLDTLVAGIKASSALTLPFECATSGAVLVNMVLPFEEGKTQSTTLLTVTGEKAIPVDLSTVRGIDIDNVLSYFPYGSKEVLSIWGRKKSDSAQNESPRESFVVFFGATGQYEHYVDLGAVLAGTVAVLPSGDLLVSGHNLAERIDTLAIYSSSGSLIRPLDQPMTAQERDTSFPRVNTTGVITHGEDVLVYRAGTRNPILEIGQKDTVREIPLALPPGALISEMVASDDSFIVHSYPEHDTTKAIDVSQGTYYEFDTLDGSLMRVLKSGSQLVNILACKSGGRFTAFVTNSDRQFMKMSAQ